MTVGIAQTIGRNFSRVSSRWRKNVFFSPGKNTTQPFIAIELDLKDNLDLVPEVLL